LSRTTILKLENLAKPVIIKAAESVFQDLLADSAYGSMVLN
jgi:hypothetical protein